MLADRSVERFVANKPITFDDKMTLLQSAMRLMEKVPRFKA